MPTTVLRVFRDPKVGDAIEGILNTKDYSQEFSLTDTYQVIFSDENATPVNCLSAVDPSTMVAVPQLSGSYSGASGLASSLVCVRVSPKRRTDNSNVWGVSVEFKNIPLMGSASKWNVNIRVTPVIFEQDSWEDKTITAVSGHGKPIVNSAYQVYNPTLKRTYYDEEIAVDFDSATVDIASIDQCKGCYNQSDVTMSVNGLQRKFKAKTLVFVAPTYSTIYTGRPPYDWKCSYVFRYRKDTWIDKVLDKGYYILKTPAGGGAPVKVITRDTYGMAHGEPVLLDGAGKEMVLPAAGGTITPHYNEFDMYTGTDFTSLLADIV